MTRRNRKRPQARKFSTQQELSLLNPTRRPFVRKRALQTPNSARRNYLLASTGRASPRAAVKAFCLECLQYDRAAIDDCTGYACPLYSYRPLKQRRRKDG